MIQYFRSCWLARGADGQPMVDRRRGWRLRRPLVAMMVALASVALSVVATIPGSAPASADTVVAGCTIVSSPTPTHFTSCPGVNFSQVNLSGLNLSYANLAGAVFAACPQGASSTCYGIDLANANLHSANVSNVVFQVVNFLGMGQVNTGTANLSGVDMTQANASGATLPYMNLSSSVNVNLTGVNFSSAGLGSASLQGIDLTNIDFSGADLGSANFSGSSFVGDDFSSASLTGADFSHTELAPSDQSVPATSHNGATVSWPAPAGASGLTVGACDPPSGSLFPIANQAVSCPVRNNTSNAGIAAFNVTVTPAAPMAFTTTSLPSATIGSAYSANLGVSGGYPPYSFKLVANSGHLPAGLKLDKSTGAISGTPTKRSSTSTFTIQALDTKTPRSKGHPAIQDSVESSFTLTVV
jgi:uncharacterized protein YjbI with pentapeptide repeats